MSPIYTEKFAKIWEGLKMANFIAKVQIYTNFSAKVEI